MHVLHMQTGTTPNIIYLMLDDAGYGDFGSFWITLCENTEF